MTRYNANNERIKRLYFEWEKDANGKSSGTIDNIGAAIYSFEKFTCFKDFKQFRKDTIIAFKKDLLKKKNIKTGKSVSKTYALHTLKYLASFFKWIAWQKGYKRKIDMAEIAYFNLSEKDTKAAQAPAHKKIPTLEQIEQVIKNMPADNDVQKRNRALIAFLILTGIRVTALTTLKLKHVFLEEEYIEQDPNEVNTKFSKRITTYFFPVGDAIKNIFVDWVSFLKNDKHFGYDDPLFPKTKLVLDENDQFTRDCLDNQAWQSTTPIREIVKEAFILAGLPYYNPHSFRDTLVRIAYKKCKTPEEFKVWSQNLGHESPLTTFTSYGHIDAYRQGEIVKNLGIRREDGADKLEQIKALLS
jgi:integrase